MRLFCCPSRCAGDTATRLHVKLLRHSATTTPCPGTTITTTTTTSTTAASAVIQSHLWWTRQQLSSEVSWRVGSRRVYRGHAVPAALRASVALRAASTSSMSDVAVLSAAVLARQDDTSSAAVIQLLADDPAFKALAVAEGKLLVQRDREDDEKLEKGIQIGVARGILAANPHVDPVTTINVAGLNALDVVERILQKIPQKDGGNIIVLQGLSGTGKGTTVAKLQKALPQCVTWSNGNVFRAYTYLCMQELGKASGAPLSTLDAAQLAPELLASVEQRVTFEEFNDEFDVAIDKNTRVTDLQNTVLRTQEVSAAVPTVAQLMQGEVIRFGASAVNKLRCAGYNVLMEGRAQTLNHIPSPLRFELVISDVEVLGQRRAAQRVMAAAVQAGGAGLTSMSDKEAQDLVRAVLPSI